jgi:hypothetical protein
VTLFAALHESGFGTERTWSQPPPMSAFEGVADIADQGRYYTAKI